MKEVIAIIRPERWQATLDAAGATGYPGDGKTFVTDVEQAFTIRTGDHGL
jgi:nitrogen regulatory protein PII